jgi:hypothetical protein
MLAWLNTIVCGLICLLAIAPFPGAILLTPVTSLITLYQAVSKGHASTIPSSLMIVAALYLAPASVESPRWLAYLKVFVYCVSAGAICLFARKRWRSRTLQVRR